MCGIFMYWAREATISSKIFNDMILGAERRGQNGFGAISISEGEDYSWKSPVPYSALPETEKEKMLSSFIKPKQLVLGVCRATPETEPATSGIANLQPIHYADEKLWLAHNGAITKQDYIDIASGCRLVSKVDSEAILLKYLSTGRNLKATMESLSGSFAFVLVDQKKKQFYLVCSFNPLYHAYVKGLGYFVHSSWETIEGAMNDLVGVTRDGCNVWEYWYHSEVPPYTIITTDMDSGMQYREKFRPKFIYPGWNNKPERRSKVLVSASGGIDSSLTAFVLHKCGYDVELIHFTYGAKSEYAELLSISDFSDTTKIPHQVIDIRSVYRTSGSASMLLNDEIEVETGQKYMKSSLAWVPGRNMLFLSHLAVLAEGYLMEKEYDQIFLAAGWCQLTEETGGYPDNSARFVNSFMKMLQFGTLFGDDIKFLQIMGNITKTEQWILGDKLGFPFELTCSCDLPKVVDGKITLCKECGSTKLSRWAAIRAGVKDPRHFYSRYPDENERGHIPEDLKPDPSVPSFENIVNRLLISDSDKKKLLKVDKKRSKSS